MKISILLIKAIGIYSILFMGTILALNIFSDNPQSRANGFMGLGLILIWVVLVGSIMYKYRMPISDFVKKIPLKWQVKFVIFASILVLLEEIVTVSLTNLAQKFIYEEAFITASSNYLHTVLFHSAIVIIPMFIGWAILLTRYDFKPPQVFLLFGLVGSIAESSMMASSLIAGFWFFVYGLMVFLPSMSIPSAQERGARPLRFYHYIFAIVLPFLCIPLILPLVPILIYLYEIMDPVLFVEPFFLE